MLAPITRRRRRVLKAGRGGALQRRVLVKADDRHATSGGVGDNAGILNGAGNGAQGHATRCGTNLTGCGVGG